jgi:hypothetical protein
VKLRVGLFLCLVAVVFSAGRLEADEPYRVGDEMVAIVLDDQHEVSRSIDGGTRQVLFTRDMDAGDAVKAALAENGAKLLDASGTVYLADISGMPGLVRRLFAMPGLRKREYSMVLDIEGEVTRRIPSEAGRATLVSLDRSKITSFAYLEKPEAVAAALTAPK